MSYVSERITAGGSADTSVVLSGVIVKKQYNTDIYELELRYTLDSPGKVQELHIPRAVLPMNTKLINIERRSNNPYGPDDYVADLGFGKMRLLPDVDGAAFTITTIKEKTKEMTLEEIEKKLGHKVKIVSKETK